jgi:hypothetical protein
MTHRARLRGVSEGVNVTTISDHYSSALVGQLGGYQSNEG